MDAGTPEASPPLRGLTRNPALPPALLDRLVAGAGADLCATLADRPDLTPAHAGTLLARGGAVTAVTLVRRGLVEPVDVRSDPRAVLALLHADHAPAWWARDLVRHPDPAVRAELASCPVLPPDVIEALARDDDVDVVAPVAASAPLAEETAAALARHRHAAVRSALAGNGHAPASLLAALAVDGGQPAVEICHACQGQADRQTHRSCDHGVHAGAIQDIQLATVMNPATPPHVLAGFAGHPSALIRWQLARRRDLPSEVYRRLAADPIPGVRWDLAENPAIGEPLIRVLATDTSSDLRRRLALNPAVPLDVLATAATSARIGPTLVPRVATASAEELRRLAASGVRQLRMLVAQRPDLPPDLVNTLAGDPDPAVATSIASHPGLSPAQLRAIVTRHGARVFAGVARNPHCPTDVLYHLATHGRSGRVYREIAGHANTSAATLLLCLAYPRALAPAARHPALPPSTIVELLDHPDTDVSDAAAANPSLPVHEMERLVACAPTS